MATNSTDVYWSKAYALTPAMAVSSTATLLGRSPAQMVDYTTTHIEPPHECDVIQRMSEQYRALGL